MNECYATFDGSFVDAFVIDHVIITDLTVGNALPINLDLTKEIPGKTNFGLKLKEGLYSIGISYNKGKYQSFVIEVKSSDINSEQASSLDVVTYPVPIVGNTFNLQLTTKETITFTYQLIDLYGNELYREDIDLKGGSTTTKLISPDEQLMTGVIAQRFMFADDSVKTIFIYK